MIPVQPKAAATGAHAREGLLLGRRILIADDSVAIRFVAATALRAQGAIVQEAADGKEALEKALGSCFDIIIMDVQMPDLDGTEATQMLRDAGLNVPVLALTSGSAESRPACIAAGMNDVLSKPFTQALFVNEVLRLLGCCAADLSAQERRPQSEQVVLFSTESLRALCGGNTQFMQRMLGIAVQELPSAAVQMRAALAHGYKDQLARLCHRVRPCVEGLGVAALRDKLLRAEAMATGVADSDALERHIWAVADELERIARCIINER